MPPVSYPWPVNAQRPEIVVAEDAPAIVGDMLAEQAGQGGSIVLTGGSVGDVYERAARAAPDWSRVAVWWGDERCVPPEHELSNFKLAKETLLDNLAAKPREVHRILGELTPTDAADRLDAELAGVTLDFLLLGLGPDGHCASLFPDSPQLKVEDRRAVSGPAGLDPYVERVTMTMPTLQGAKRIVFVATGEHKAEAVARAFGGDVTPDVPASLVRLAPVRVEVVVDAAAAARLER
jgi:6-phosphogluconolactonase